MLPKDAAAQLGVSGGTLRKWALEFAPWLDTTITPGKGNQRRYASDDMATLQRIHQLLHERYTYDEVRERLGPQKAPQQRQSDAIAPQEQHDTADQVLVLDERPELAMLRQLLEAQVQVIDQQKEQIASEQRHSADKSVFIDQLQRQLATAESERTALQDERAALQKDIRKLPRWVRALWRI